MRNLPIKYRVAQWGTGSVGGTAARHVLEHPLMDLVACFAHSESKVGQDAGALIGQSPIGIKATNNIEDIIAAKPDCLLYMPLLWNVDHMAQLLQAGINVISTANFITGRSYGDAAVKKLQEAAQRGGASLYGTGINPGQANSLALATLAACSEVRKVTVREAVDATHYASKETWIALGIGGAPDAPDLANRVKERSLVFIDAVEMMADALKVAIDDIGFEVDFATAIDDVDLGYMQIEKGRVCGLRMTYAGRVAGKSVIELQLVWRLGYSMTPDWPVEGYVVEVEGEPSLRTNFQTIEDKTGGSRPTAMNAIHAIPAVCNARPGIITAADLPLVTAAHCVTTRDE